MKFLIAKKLEMSQRFREDGTVVPVTVLRVEEGVVTQVKTREKDGYVAVQVGYGRSKHPTKPLIGHLKAAGKALHTLMEFRVDGQSEQKVGEVVPTTVFSAGEFVEVTGVSKGKGFQGVVKRHHFRGGPASHGHKDNLRMPGSIGSGGMQRVFKGVRMGGRMGGERVTVKNLEVVEVDAENGTIAIKGAVPGATGEMVIVRGGYPSRMGWK